ncbi:hypothetical protein NQZ68_022558 [Dissostichus eleginoides]|nr:hypothetical protein NQZ68_022558 [Dissostichus eleginoides]
MEAGVEKRRFQDEPQLSTCPESRDSCGSVRIRTGVRTLRMPGIDCSFTRWSLHNLVDHRAPEILDFMSPSNPMVPQVNHLANWEMCLPDSLSGLVFDHPVLYPARYRLLHSTQEKVYRKLRFLSKHQIER